LCRQNFRARHAIVIIVRIEACRDAKLAKIVYTNGIVSLGLGPSERRQEQTGKNGDDADHDEEFDEGEGVERWSVEAVAR
jgi:hypothetical protein